jgi:hypothetical protein
MIQTALNLSRRGSAAFQVRVSHQFDRAPDMLCRQRTKRESEG